MVKLREARLETSPLVIRTAQFLIFLSIPYKKTDTRSITRSSRLGDGSWVTVTFTAMIPGVPLPYGSDVNLLHWMIGKAIDSRSPFVSWDSAMEYLRWAKLSKGGRTLRQLREKYKRIAGMAVTIVRTGATIDEENFILPIIEASRLPKSIKPDAKTDLATAGGERKALGFQFSERFFQDFLKHNVPMLKDVLVLVGERPQLQQYIGFLGWRSWCAEAPSTISWNNVRDQLWQQDTNVNRIRQRFKETITALRIAWPELQAEARPNGLYIAPPVKGVQFIPGLPRPKREQEIVDQQMRFLN
jgi:hypothetical protein